MRRLLILAIVLGACGNSPGAGTDGGGDDAPPGDGGADDGTDGAPDDGMETDGPIISNCPAGDWCVETLPQGVTALIHGIDAVDANDVFAVGDGGVVLRRQNGTWSAMTSTTTSNLRGVWARASNDVWAVGVDGAVIRWDGANWAAVPNAPNRDYTAVWGSSATDVWLAGTASAVHWTGTFTSAAITGTPVGISGTASNDIWIASESGYVSHYTTSWALVQPNGSSALGTSYFSIAMRTGSDVWASTPTSGTIRWNGATWTPYSTGTTLFAGMYAPGADNAWGVGSTKIGHWNGQAWTVATPSGLTNSLYGVSGVGPHTWAVGANATILYHHD